MFVYEKTLTSTLPRDGKHPQCRGNLELYTSNNHQPSQFRLVIFGLLNELLVGILQIGNRHFELFVDFQTTVVHLAESDGLFRQVLKEKTLKLTLETF